MNLLKRILALVRVGLCSWWACFKGTGYTSSSWKRGVMRRGMDELVLRAQEVREALEEEQRQHNAAEAQRARDLESLRLIFREELEAALGKHKDV